MQEVLLRPRFLSPILPLPHAPIPPFQHMNRRLLYPYLVIAIVVVVLLIFG